MEGLLRGLRRRSQSERGHKSKKGCHPRSLIASSWTISIAPCHIPICPYKTALLKSRMTSLSFCDLFSLIFLILKYIRPLLVVVFLYFVVCLFCLFSLLCFVVCRVSNSLCKVSLYSAGRRGKGGHNDATHAL